MRGRWTTTALILCALWPPVAFADEGEANRLFVEAVKLWQEAEGRPVAERWELYAKIKENLDSIVEHHPDSSLAVKLVIGEKVGPIDREYLEHVLEEYTPEKRAEAAAIEAAVRAAFADRSRRLKLRCRRDEKTPWAAYELAGRISPPDDRFEGGYGYSGPSDLGRLARGEVGNPFVNGRFLPPRTLQLDDPGMTFEFDATGRARGRAGSRECVLDLPEDLRLRLRLRVGCAPADRLCRVRALLDFARTIDDPWSRSQVLMGIALEQAKAGYLESARQSLAQALEAARTIAEDSDTRGVALREIARMQAELGEVAKALETARAIPEGWFERTRALGEIAVVQAKTGDPKRALETIQNIRNGWVLSQVSVAQAEGGDVAGALETASRIWRLETRVETLSRVMSIQARTGDRDGVERTYAEALKIARAIKDAHNRNFALRAIAWAQAEAGDVAGALETARAIEDSGTYDSALRWIAGAVAEAGSTRQALEIARTIEDADQRFSALEEIAAALVETGDATGALEIARSMGDAYQRSWILSKIAAAQAKAGDVTGARRTVARALEAAQDIVDHPVRRDSTLQGIAVVLAEVGDLEEALRIVDSIESKYDRAQARVEALIAAARRELREFVRFPLLSQLDRGNYRDAGLYEATDCYDGRRVEVPKLACLATVYTMIARGFGKADARIDDFYTDPRNGRCGVGAVPTVLPAGIAVDGPGEEKRLDPEIVEANIRDGLPVILHGRSPNLVDHFVLVVGTYRDDEDRLVLVVNDPLPDPGTVEPKRRELVVAQAQTAGLFGRAAWQATGENGFVFDRMRLVYRK